MATGSVLLNPMTKSGDDVISGVITYSAVDSATITDGTIVVADLAANAVETTTIKNANVTLAKLAAGITPSHVVKFFKLGSTITGTTLTGLVSGDLVVSILANGTATVAACAAPDTLPADPANDTYVIVFRAAA